MTSPPAARVIGYTRVSTEDQASHGHGLAAQRAAIEAGAAQRGWIVDWVTDDGYSAKNLERPGITGALERLRSRKVNGLVVAKLDRLTRSLLDFANLMARAQRERWAIVALDLGVDTSTPQGEMMANVLAAFAQFERRLIGQRTREGLAAAKARGIELGNPRRRKGRASFAVRHRILGLRSSGLGYAAVAAKLNEDGVPTSFGGARWYASSVRTVALRSS